MLKQKEFFERITTNVQERLGDDYRAVLKKEWKNNDICSYGLQIHADTVCLMDTLPLQPFYQKYVKGEPLESLAEEVAEDYRNKRKERYLQAGWLHDWEQMKERLVVKLVNQEKNRESLKEVFSLSFLDLAVPFYLIVNQEIPKEGKEIQTLPVTEKMVKRWGKDENELLEQAVENLERYLPKRLLEFQPFQLNTVYDMEALEKRKELDIPKNKLLIMTNQDGNYGAAAMLDTKCLGKIARLIGSDLYIFPSSVHEVILHVRKEGEELDNMKKLVCDVNQKLLRPGDYLSDSVYFFDKDTQELKIAI